VLARLVTDFKHDDDSRTSDTGGDMLPPSKQFAVVHTATNAPESAIIEGPAADVLMRVAHEMRQPLAAATSALQLLEECPDNRVVL
jgi:hypothetical protein